MTHMPNQFAPVDSMARGVLPGHDAAIAHAVVVHPE